MGKGFGRGENVLSSEVNVISLYWMLYSNFSYLILISAVQFFPSMKRSLEYHHLLLVRKKNDKDISGVHS